MAYAKVPPPAAYDNTQVCCISFNLNNCIRLMRFPNSMTDAIREAILKSWGKIAEERNYHGAHEFKVKGNPWLGEGQEVVGSRRLLAAILQTMALNGWNLLQAADVSKKPDDKDTMFFEYKAPDPETHIFAISFNMADRIRVIDAPDFVPCVVEAVKTQWPRGIQSERDYYGSKEVKLKGDPWEAEESETVYTRLLLCQIIDNVKSKGYKLYGSIDISTAHHRDSSYLESWVFRRVTPFYG